MKNSTKLPRQFILPFLMVFVSAISSSAQYTLTDDDVVVTDGLIESCSYDFAIKDIIIPDTLDGQTVIGIGDDDSNLFYRKGITSINLPSTLEIIGYCAFYDNSLTSITIPSLVTDIKYGAFYANNVTDITIPKSVISIGEAAFQYNKLTSVSFEMNSNIESIEVWAFSGNTGLASLILPTNASPNFIEYTDGHGNTYDGGDEISDFNTFYYLDSPYTLTDDDVVVINGIIESCSYNFNSKSIIIPDNLDGQTVIGFGSSNSNLFYRKSITSVQLPSTLQTIGSYAFASNSLTSITIPNSVTSIGEYAFIANSLSGITILNSATSIDNGAFNKNQITTVNSAPSDGIFYARNTDDSKDYTTVVSYGGVAEIIDFIPNTVTTIGHRAFYLNGLTGVTIPNSVTHIGVEAFDTNYLTNVTIPNSVTDIGIGAFSWNDLISVTIPNSVTSIGVKAFYLNDITNVQFESNSNIEKIGDKAFYSNSGLSSISLPTHANPNFVHYKDANSNTYSSGDAITNFEISYEAVISAQTVSYEVNFVDWDGTELKVDSVAEGGSATPPAGPTRAGYTFAGWDVDFSNVTSDLTVTAQYQSNYYTLTDDDVVVTDGMIESCSYDFAIKEIIIPDTLDGQVIMEIGNWNYRPFYDKGITTVQLPSKLQIVGDLAFTDNHLTNVIIPNTVTQIGYRAFSNNNLNSLTLSNSVVKILGGAFSSNNLTDLAIPNSVTSIFNQAFENNSLITLTIPSSVTSIGHGAFNDNQITTVNGSPSNGIIYNRNADGSEDYTSIVSYGAVPDIIDFIPNTVTTIGYWAFCYNNLTSVTIPNTVTEIIEGAIINNALTSVTFEANSSIEKIEEKVFLNNSGLTSITLPTHANPNFKEYKDVNETSYNPGDNITDFSIAYRAEMPYTLTDDDVVVTNGVIESCSYDFAIKNIIIPDVLDGQTVIGVGDDYNNLFREKGITSVQLPSTIQTIGTQAFQLNDLAGITLPNSVTSIGNAAFSRNNLTEVIMPGSVTSIGSVAFTGNSLVSITIPNSVTSIGGGAFNDNQIIEYNGTASSGFIYGRNTDGSEDYTTIVSFGGVADIIDFIPNLVISIGDLAFASNGLTGVTMFVKAHGLQKLKIRLYTKLVPNLTDFSFVLNSFSLKYPKNTFL